MSTVNWNIRHEGRTWEGEEADSRWTLTPEKFEMNEGKLFFSEEERMTLLGLLLENVGIDKAITLGDPKMWISAIEKLK